MAWWAVGATVASSVMGAAGAEQQGESAAAAARYNAQIAQQNSEIAQQQGAAAGETQDRAARTKIGSMVANYGASGVDGGSGSPMDVIAESVRMATLDNLTTQYNYKLRAQGYKNQSGLDEANAENSLTAGHLNAAAALFKGAGSAIPMFGGGGGGLSSGGSASYPGADASSTQA